MIITWATDSSRTRDCLATRRQSAIVSLALIFSSILLCIDLSASHSSISMSLTMLLVLLRLYFWLGECGREALLTFRSRLKKKLESFIANFWWVQHSSSVSLEVWSCCSLQRMWWRCPGITLNLEQFMAGVFFSPRSSKSRECAVLL